MDVGLTVAPAGLQASRRVRVRLADALVDRPPLVAAAGLADIGVPEVPARLLEVVGQAVLAVASLGVVLAVLAHPP